MAMLEINHLQKKFGTTEVLRDVSLSVSKGDVVAILGPSGSGKTTLLRCVNFLERADAGELLFDDEKFDLNRASHRGQLQQHIQQRQDENQQEGQGAPD